MITEAQILAAGKGTRMWPLTENTPKPLLPLCGKSIIEQQILVLRKVGVTRINILIGHRMKEISDLLGDGKSYDCLLYTSPSPRDATLSRMPSSA